MIEVGDDVRLTKDDTLIAAPGALRGAVGTVIEVRAKTVIVKLVGYGRTEVDPKILEVWQG